MPIHSVEVITEMNRQGHYVSVLTAISPRFLRGSDWPETIKVHQVPILNFRIIRVLSFFLASLVLLPYWFFRERPDIIYERFSLTSVGTLWVARALDIPLVVEVNGIIGDELALSRLSHWRSLLQQWVERRVFPCCDRIITVTEGIRQWIGSHYSVSLEKIDTISNGVNPRRFHPMDKVEARREFGLDLQRPIVGYLGSLFPWAGLELLIEASVKVSAQIPQVLFLVGGGQEKMKADLERRVHALGMEEHFLFWGEVPWDRAALFISTFDIAVAPARFSNLRSGISPQKVYAYLACERPVVGSNIEGLGDLLAGQGVGLSFQVGDIEDLAEAILTLLKDQDVATSMGQRGRRVVLESFTWERAVMKTAQLLYGCLGPLRESETQSSVS